MENEIEMADLTEKLREALAPESLRASIKQANTRTFRTDGKRVRVEISARNYDLDIRAFERDGLKTLELSMSPALLARIIEEYGQILQRTGIPFPHRELHQAFMRAHTAINEARAKRGNSGTES